MPTIHTLANDLRIACQQVSRRVRFDAGGDLAPHQVSVLAKLKAGPRTPGELADAEQIAPPSMTKTVNCLADRGLVTRIDHPTDGRSKLVVLTDEGRAQLARTARARDDWMEQKLRGLSPAELDVLREATGLLARVLER
ncbi:MarR family winged helix-turn-helix transcriptional regulator [Micropruina sonneratiae]|uniref:MarR family winged helix-turn-helix transcriptional regulator n=1 Tax=Micropruina sonneratiae TaxID=2986940 RepID=UPI0022276C75|nr:MarR family transcriptional regulator [Micropruina sp. KQZ13P-5]MCW3158417.1 MarR family transcriptional regulator [Micropruina sp. KQZ13P-5]